MKGTPSARARGQLGAFETGFPDGDPTPSSLRFLQWRWMDELCQAVVETVEEATVNALVANDDSASAIRAVRSMP